MKKENDEIPTAWWQVVWIISYSLIGVHGWGLTGGDRRRRDQFFLIIDKQRSDNNVYFLDYVTEKDLISLAKKDKENPLITEISQPETKQPEPEIKEEKPEEKPVEEETSEKKQSNAGMVLILLLVPEPKTDNGQAVARNRCAQPGMELFPLHPPHGGAHPWSRIGDLPESPVRVGFRYRMDVRRASGPPSRNIPVPAVPGPRGGATSPGACGPDRKHGPPSARQYVPCGRMRARETIAAAPFLARRSPRARRRRLRAQPPQAPRTSGASHAQADRPDRGVRLSLVAQSPCPP